MSVVFTSGGHTPFWVKERKAKGWRQKRSLQVHGDHDPEPGRVHSEFLDENRRKKWHHDEGDLKEIDEETQHKNAEVGNDDGTNDTTWRESSILWIHRSPSKPRKISAKAVEPTSRNITMQVRRMVVSMVSLRDLADWRAHV